MASTFEHFFFETRCVCERLVCVIKCSFRERQSMENMLGEAREKETARKRIPESNRESFFFVCSFV